MELSNMNKCFVTTKTRMYGVLFNYIKTIYWASQVFNVLFKDNLF